MDVPLFHRATLAKIRSDVTDLWIISQVWPYDLYFIILQLLNQIISIFVYTYVCTSFLK